MDVDFATLLVNESPDALIAVTSAGVVRHWDKGAQSLFGYAAAEALGRKLNEIVVPSDRIQEEEILLRQVLHSGAVTYETTRRRKDGSLIYVAVSGKLVHDPASRTDCILLSKKDVTQLKARRDGKLVNARFGGLLEAMPDGIVMVNSTGRIVFSNAQADTLFGYPRGELRGKPIELLLPARFRDGHVGHRSGFLTKPRTRTMGMGLELFGLRHDGSEFPVEISLSPLETEEGTLVASAIRDITERKRVEHALQEKNIELQNVNRAKDSFLAGMSHELRTPLNAIIGFTGTLLMKLPGPLNADQEKQLRTIQTSGKHLLALINDLLDLAKIEAGKMELNVEQIDAASVLEEVATALTPLAETKGLTLKVTIAGLLPAVHVDRRALSQIVINLVSNAIKFTEQGIVELKLERNSVGGRKCVAVAVTDSGVGIRLEDQAKLFAAFSRVDASGHRVREGTGLGLHLSQILAEAMGGKIVLQSEYGKGSTFTLLLPDED